MRKRLAAFSGTVRRIVGCFFGKHEWEREWLRPLNALPGETGYICKHCRKYKCVYNGRGVF
jgi:hypothetical protein